MYIDTTGLLHIDASCIDMVEQWERRYTAQGGAVSVSWRELELRKKTYVQRMMEIHGVKDEVIKQRNSADAGGATASAA